MNTRKKRAKLRPVNFSENYTGKDGQMPPDMLSDFLAWRREVVSLLDQGYNLALSKLSMERNKAFLDGVKPIDMMQKH